METFTKLAGMTETTDANEKPSQPIPEPPPIPQDNDAEAQNDSPQHSQRASRASLPLNRHPSHKSFRSSKATSRSRSRDNRPAPGDYPPPPSQRENRPSHESAGTGASDADEDFTWGPSHPCFPHPNPHCAPDSEEHKSTRVIRVKRDWLQAGDLYPQYANLYPEILDPLVTDDEFRFLISALNSRLKSTFDPYTPRAWADALVGAFTGFIWDDLGLTGSKNGVKGLEAFVEGWNEGKRKEGKDVKVVQLRRTGFMALDFVIPDPGIDGADREGEDGEEEGGIGPAM